MFYIHLLYHVCFFKKKILYSFKNNTCTVSTQLIYKIRDTSAVPSLPQPKPTFANQVFVPAQSQQLTQTHAGVSGGTPVSWMISEIPGDVAAFVGTHRSQFFFFVCVKHLHTLRNSNNTNTCHSKWKQLQKSLMAHSDIYCCSNDRTHLPVMLHVS